MTLCGLVLKSLAERIRKQIELEERQATGALLGSGSGVPVPAVGIDSGMVGIGEITDAVPEEVKAQALELKEMMAAGEYHPFTGPINKQDGSVWLEEGETASDEDLLGMDFYVEGLTGEIPN